VGVVLEPVKRITFTFDYYNIRRDDEIVPAPLGLLAPVRGVQQPGTTYPGPIIYYPPAVRERRQLANLGLRWRHAR